MFQFKKLQNQKLKQEMKAIGREIRAKKKVIRNLKKGYKQEENEKQKDAIVQKLKQEITNLSLLRVSFAEKQVEASKRLVEFATEFYARSCVQLEKASYMARNEIRQRPDELTGEGLAIAGIVMGWIAVGLAVVGLLFGGGIAICAMCSAFGVSGY